jgi:hypothetical protein
MQNPDLYTGRAKIAAREAYAQAFPNKPPVAASLFYVVWFSKTLANWKALLSSDAWDDGTYIEVTFDGANECAYVDVYSKALNTLIRFDA